MLCVFIVLNSNYLCCIQIYFKPIQMLFKPKNFLRGPGVVSEHPQTPQLGWLSLHSLFCRLYSLLGSCVIVAYRAPDWRKPATHNSGEPRRVLILFVRYLCPEKSAQIIFLQHFWEVLLVLFKINNFRPLSPHHGGEGGGGGSLIWVCSNASKRYPQIQSVFSTA